MVDLIFLVISIVQYLRSFKCRGLRCSCYRSLMFTRLFWKWGSMTSIQMRRLERLLLWFATHFKTTKPYSPHFLFRSFVKHNGTHTTLFHQLLALILFVKYNSNLCFQRGRHIVFKSRAIYIHFKRLGTKRWWILENGGCWRRRCVEW